MWPKLDEMREWPRENVQEQYDYELAEHRRLLGERRGEYHATLSRHYRLGYMRWLLDGAPQPQPRFV